MKNIENFIFGLKNQESQFRWQYVISVKNNDIEKINYYQNKLNEIIFRIEKLAEFYNLEQFKSSSPF